MRDVGTKSAHLLASNRRIHSQVWPRIVPHQLPSLVLILEWDVEAIQIPEILDAKISRQTSMTYLTINELQAHPRQVLTKNFF